MTSSAALRRDDSYNSAPPPPTPPISREGYRDEMNLAEFPLALLDRPAPGQKTIHFSDTIYDASQKKPVTRRLTIAGSDLYDLPTPRDEEVILGLIHLSHQSNFESQKVHFTKGSLVRLLGWSDDGRSYKRITESLNKWASITLIWDKAWWSKESQSWVDETFHIIERVTSLGKESAEKSSKQNPHAGQSSFVWSAAVYESFRSGYIKKLDLDFFKSLESAISKKMFRFLDKRFYQKRRFEFDLQVFAFEHLGLSRNYHNGEIKRKLRPAIKELEDKGFLEELPDNERFIKETRGVWKVVFIKKGSRAGEQQEQKLDSHNESSHTEHSTLLHALIGRGVSAPVAKKLLSEHPPEHISQKLKHFDEKLEKGDAQVPKNPAGFLVSAIKNDFDLDTKQSRQNLIEEKRKAKLLSTSKTQKHLQLANAAQEQKEKQLREERLRTFTTWWNTLTPPEQQAFETQAVKHADKFLAKQYEQGRAGQGSLFRTTRENILISHYERCNKQLDN